MPTPVTPPKPPHPAPTKPAASTHQDKDNHEKTASVAGGPPPGTPGMKGDPGHKTRGQPNKEFPYSGSVLNPLRDHVQGEPEGGTPGGPEAKPPGSPAAAAEADRKNHDNY